MLIGSDKKDPLLKTGPDQQRELFKQFSQLAKGFQTEDVIGAAANILVNGFRQAYAKGPDALRAYEERMAKFKGILAEHYDLNGRRKSIFPHNQVVEMPFFDFTKKNGGV